jgi:1-phosphofructokinase/tagatose 6-phosphate kinase
MILCVAANPSIDKLFEVDGVHVGQIHRPEGFIQVPGGKGLNVARAARALGADVKTVSILRGHAGAWIEESLVALGIRGRSVWSKGETRSSLSVADSDTLGLTEFYEDGPDTPSSSWEEFSELAISSLEGASWMTVSGSLPAGVPDDGYVEMLVRAKAAGVMIALDAAGAALRNAIGVGPNAVKVNSHEASEFLGGPVDTRREAVSAAQKLRERAGGMTYAMVTRGAEGVVVATPQGSVLEGSLHVRGRYPVGSGDSFLAGLVVGLERGLLWPVALQLALGAAAANAERKGAGQLDRARAEILAAQAEVVPAVD